MLRAYDYKCPKGHVTEKFLSKFVQKGPCGYKGCREEGEYCPSFWYTSPLQTTKRVQNAQRFSPVVVHRDKSGNLRFPGSANARVPKGFQKVELATVEQVRAFEREVNRKGQVEADKFRNSRQMLTDGQLKENRRVLDDIRNGAAWTSTDPQTGREVMHRGLSPKGERFLDAMRQQSQEKQRLGPKPTKPEFVVEAFSQNQSNRDSYYNENGGSHRR